MGFRIRESSRLDSKVIVFTIIRNTATTTATTTAATTTQKWLKYTYTSTTITFEFYCHDFLPGATTPAYLDMGLMLATFQIPPILVSYGYHGGGAFFYPASIPHMVEANAVLPTLFEIDSNKKGTFIEVRDSREYIISEIIILQGVSTTTPPTDIHIKLQKLLLYAQKAEEIADDLLTSVTPTPTTTTILSYINTIIQSIKTNATTAANAATTFTSPITTLDIQVIALFNKSKDLTSQNLTILAQATSAASTTGATANNVENAITNTTPPHPGFTQIKEAASQATKNPNPTAKDAIQNISRCMYYMGNFHKVVHDITTMSTQTPQGSIIPFITTYEKNSDDLIKGYKLVNEIIKTAVQHAQSFTTHNYTLTNVVITSPLTTYPNNPLPSTLTTMMSKIVKGIIQMTTQPRYVLATTPTTPLQNLNAPLFDYTTNPPLTTIEIDILKVVETFNKLPSATPQLYKLIAELMTLLKCQTFSKIHSYISPPTPTPPTPPTWSGIRTATIFKHPMSGPSAPLNIDEMRHLL
jgi:hypothetical protein